MEQEQNIQKLADDLHKVKNDFTSIKAKIDVIFNAIKGNPLTEDGGMVQRIIESEKDIVLLEARITLMEQKENRQAFYLKVIWTLVGGAVVLAVNYLLTMFIKR